MLSLGTSGEASFLRRWRPLARLLLKEHERTRRTSRALQEIITPSQVADLLQVHVKTVYRLAEQGIIPGNKIGRRWRFSRQRILDLVADYGSGPDGSTARHLRGNPSSPRS